ncbi:phage major capsid protein, HK97 family [Fodinibius roseus]|uniref:Phage major capsid protein, HK97 family n=1 Tax=Fodinibius roseus TaxID=1194090 RepID=A0A1M4UQZ6_9BACT|nr:phage major capsid protein [Fodinibius roseus]SHE59067.1 phage major capsid protein, HK97 family [Fodinibius roseus]
MDRVRQLKEQIGTARKEIHNLRTEKRDLTQRADQIDDDLPQNEWNEKFKNIKGQISKIDGKIEMKNSLIDDAFAELETLTDDLSIASNNDLSKFLPGAATGGVQPEGGRALDEEGKIRLYHPGQSLKADHQPDREYSDVDLGSYLRAVVQGPRNNAERQVIQNSVTSDNYELPVHIAAELVDRLRATNPLLKENGAGARTIELEGGETKFVKTSSDPDAVWHSEMAEETPTDPSFTPVSMDPKTILSMTEIGRETLQDSQNIEEALTNAFVGSLNEGILNATFTGAGTADEPEGLSSVITQTEEYTNGGDPDWSNFVNASKTLYDNNVPEDNRSFIHDPNVWQSLALTTDNNGRYQDAPSFIRDIPNYVTSGLADGTAYAGDFSNVVYGFRLQITIEQFRGGASAKKYGSLWVAAARLDIATFRPAALVRIEEASA